LVGFHRRPGVGGRGLQGSLLLGLVRGFLLCLLCGLLRGLLLGNQRGPLLCLFFYLLRAHLRSLICGLLCGGLLRGLRRGLLRSWGHGRLHGVLLGLGRGLLHGLPVGLLRVLLSGLLLRLLHGLLCGQLLGLRGDLLCGLMWGLWRCWRFVLVGLRRGLPRTCCVLGGRVGGGGSGEGALLGAADGYVRARCGWVWARRTGALSSAAATRIAPVSGRLCWLLGIGLGLQGRRGVLFGEHVGVGGLFGRLPLLLQLSSRPRPPELLPPHAGPRMECFVGVRFVADERPALGQSGVAEVGGAVNVLPWPSWCDRDWPRPWRAGRLRGPVG
jgi:hypothetical protein